MGFLDDAKQRAEQLLKAGQEKFSEAVDATEGFADDKTGGKFSDVKQKVSEFVEESKDKLGDLVGEGKDKVDEVIDEGADKLPS